MRDDRGLGLNELFDYKNQLMEDMLTNKAIVRLLTNDEKLRRSPMDLVYKQVFPFEFVPKVAENATTYVCCEVDIREVFDKTFLSPVLYIWVFTHEDLACLPRSEGGGVRTDKLASEITKSINGSRMYGLGELNLCSVKGFAPINEYQGRMLTFLAKDFNRKNPTGKPIPANRKRG